MIQVTGLGKSFVNAQGASVAAVDKVTFNARAGEIFGLLGPNGAGKTTTLRLLCTVLRPTFGAANIAGHDVVTAPGLVRRSIGFLSANTGIYDRMTAYEFVAYYGRLHGLTEARLQERIELLFEQFRLNDFRNLIGSRMSTGMKQKVSIARALIHDPPVLIFDEPTSGLDILVQRAVLQNIRSLKDQGKCIIFSTCC